MLSITRVLTRYTFLVPNSPCSSKPGRVLYSTSQDVLSARPSCLLVLPELVEHLLHCLGTHSEGDLIARRSSVLELDEDAGHSVSNLEPADGDEVQLL